MENPTTTPEEDLVDFDIQAWLAPVKRDDEVDMAEIYRCEKLGIENPVINMYSCENGHQTVTIDRVEHVHQLTIICPYATCKKEARSHFYFCDQGLNPTHEFYSPSDPNAHAKKNRGKFRRGAVAFKNIMSEEPIRLGKKLKSSLSKPVKIPKNSPTKPAKK